VASQVGGEASKGGGRPEGPRGPAQVEEYASWLIERGEGPFDTYGQLHRWSVAQPSTFWRSVWDYFDIRAPAPPQPAIGSLAMPGGRWFPGTTLNYVDQVLRHAGSHEPAIIGETEPGAGNGALLSWVELARQVAAVAHTLRGLGVAKGDRVVGYLPNIAETVVAFLATATIGALWSACGQDYSSAAAEDRLRQLEPVVLFASDGYHHGGSVHDRRPAIAVLRERLVTVRATIMIRKLGLATGDAAGVVDWEDASAGDHPLQPAKVDFDHPLWVLFSSGTTGKPKGIVHGHGGVVLEHLKQLAFHLDLRRSDRYFWYTSPSWMMWNFQVAGLLLGATIVCYDGSPSTPGPDALWGIAARHGVRLFGTSPAYLQRCEKSGVEPGTEHDLSSLRTVGTTGSVLAAASSRWVAANVGAHVTVASISGGTDVVSAFAGSVPTVAVRPGEVSVPCLGVALEAWDRSGHPVVGEVGELVITQPLPSMPLQLWNDPDGTRYRQAYFAVFPGAWRHGDWITVTERGSVVFHGRSDSTLNRNGIRMGSAEIYQVVEALPEIREALIVGVEGADGSYWMPLFVDLLNGATLDDDLSRRVRQSIRDGASPHHVPDAVIAVEAIPHTRTGKKLEVPVKRILQGGALCDVVDPRAVDAPDLLDSYVDLARRRPAP